MKLINAKRLGGKFKRKNNLVKLEIPSKRWTSFAENLQPEKKKKKLVGNDRLKQVLIKSKILG